MNFENFGIIVEINENEGRVNDVLKVEDNFHHFEKGIVS